MIPRTVLRAILALVLVALVTACGAHRMSPVDPRPVAGLTPQIDDAEAGLVAASPDFSIKG